MSRLRTRTAAIAGMLVGAIMAPIAAMAFSFNVWTSQNGDQALTSALLSAITGYNVGPVVNTAVTATTGTTLSAAALKGGLITRTGPTAGFTDTTDTAANIAASYTASIKGQLGNNSIAGQTFEFIVKNGTIYTETLAGGTGVTMPSTVIVPPLSAATYLGTIGGTTAAPTVTMVHISTVPIKTSQSVSNPAATAITTVGAGTLTAAAINTGVITRGGVQVAAFTDTTDTAANIIAGIGNLTSPVGSSNIVIYVNNTVFPATIAGGTGVTMAGATVIPANSWAEYLITVTASNTVTMTAIEQGYFPASGTVTANGATAVVVSNAAVTANSVITFTLKTVGGTPAGAPYLSAVTPGTGFSVKAVAGDTSVYSYEIRG